MPIHNRDISRIFYRVADLLKKDNDLAQLPGKIKEIVTTDSL